jgi:hypothetical protein
VPAEARAALEFVLADDMSEVIAAALEPAEVPTPDVSRGLETPASLQPAA